MGRWTANSKNINFMSSDSEVFQNADLGIDDSTSSIMKIISYGR